MLPSPRACTSYTNWTTPSLSLSFLNIKMALMVLTLISEFCFVSFLHQLSLCMKMFLVHFTYVYLTAYSLLQSLT